MTLGEEPMNHDFSLVLSANGGNAMITYLHPYRGGRKNGADPSGCAW